MEHISAHMPWCACILQQLFAVFPVKSTLLLNGCGICKTAKYSDDMTIKRGRLDKESIVYDRKECYNDIIGDAAW